jgi:hypothetical protein
MIFPVNNLSAQETWENIIEQLVENHDEISSSNWQNLMEDLAELKEHPIPINTATKSSWNVFLSYPTEWWRTFCIISTSMALCLPTRN